jgi:hypothetical protein
MRRPVETGAQPQLSAVGTLCGVRAGQWHTRKGQGQRLIELAASWQAVAWCGSRHTLRA